MIRIRVREREGETEIETETDSERGGDRERDRDKVMQSKEGKAHGRERRNKQILSGYPLQVHLLFMK
jgi:hypothetical protein